MARQSGSSVGRGIHKSVVDSTGGSDDSTITADCGRGQGWGSADGEGRYRSTECIRADGIPTEAAQSSLECVDENPASMGLSRRLFELSKGSGRSAVNL
eukprot:scaffold69396_cov64-Attheya_sp.AAC.2